MTAGTTTHTYWDEEFECRPWAETLRWQAAQLPAFVERLRSASLLYRDALAGVEPSGIDSLPALAALPTTGKDDLRRGQEEIRPDLMLGMQQCAPQDDIVQVLSSSGTTGNPVYFGLTEHDRARWSNAIASMFCTAGLRRSSVVGLSTGMPIVAGGLPYADGIRTIGSSLVWFGGQPTPRMAATFARLPVNALIATASFCTFFAGRITELLGRPASSLEVRTVIAGGEPGMGQPDIRAGVLESWGADRVSEVMGLGDVLPGAWGECEAGRGMHFTAGQDVLVELIDPVDGSAVAWSDGAEGELVYTTFNREATPVLRFRSRDHVIVTGTDCACGRATPRIRCIGRTDDMLIFKAMNVFPSAIRDIALEVAGPDIDDIMRIRKEHRTQVRFDAPIPLEVQPAAHLSGADRSALADRIELLVQERLRVRVAVEFHPADRFPVGVYKNALTYTAGEAG
jgi:phenylacetate-coenzyme A ligase PaaK-like adenylate-forming protein